MPMHRPSHPAPSLAPVARPFEHKAAGWVLLNGNVVWETDLVDMFRSRILEPQHFDPEVNRKRKVLLVTAAFDRGQEHRDRHLIAMFERLGIEADWREHLPRNIQNLSVYTFFERFKQNEPWIYSRYTEKQAILKAMKHEYAVKNQVYVSSVQRQLEALRKTYPSLGLFELYHAPQLGRGIATLIEDEEAAVRPDKAARLADLQRLRVSASDLKSCQELHHTLEHLLYKDEEVFALCHALEEHFLEKSGVRASPLYREQQAELRERVLSSATVFLFGGRVYVLVNRLRFYDLAEAFAQAVARGTNLYGISAGAICQTQRFSLTFDRAETGGYIHAADFGMGLVKGIRIFPHANDFRSIREGRRDDLSFFALRMPNEVAVGLNERSVLLCETYRDPVDGGIYKRFSSAGTDPVLVFGTRGERHEMEPLSEMLLEGSKFYQGKPQLATRAEILDMERAWRERQA
jgi:peptidase E